MRGDCEFNRQDRLAYEISLKEFNDEQAGMEENFRLGKEEGLKKGKEEIAQNLKAAGLSAEDILRHTGVNLKDLE